MQIVLFFEICASIAPQIRQRRVEHVFTKTMSWLLGVIHGSRRQVFISRVESSFNEIGSRFSTTCTEVGKTTAAP